MKKVVAFNSKIGKVANECIVSDKEAMQVARAIMHSTGLKNTKEYFSSIVGYDANGVDSFRVSIRDI